MGSALEDCDAINSGNGRCSGKRRTVHESGAALKFSFKLFRAVMEDM